VPAAWPGRAGRYRADLTGRNEISVPRPMGREKERGLLAARLRTSKRLRSKPDSKRLNSGPICRSRYIDGRFAWRRAEDKPRLRVACASWTATMGNFVIPARKTPKKTSKVLQQHPLCARFSCGAEPNLVCRQGYRRNIQ
jgi:hypothetical protein